MADAPNDSPTADEEKTEEPHEAPTVQKIGLKNSTPMSLSVGTSLILTFACYTNEQNGTTPN